MSMRWSALVLVLALVGPGMVTAVCELACLHAHHHSTVEALAAECHGHGGAAPPSGLALSGADRTLCHGDAAAPSAIVKASPQFASATALPVGARPGLHVPLASALPGGSWCGPSDRLLITTQLRI